MFALSKTILKNGSKVIFFGDSITEAGRNYQNFNDLGSGYVRLFSDMLITREPEKQLSILNRGIGGNTVQHLLTRCHDDVTEFSPDYVFILIGINDVVRFLDKSSSLHAGSLEDFSEFYKEILSEFEQRIPQAQIILIEPFYFSKDHHSQGSYRCNLLKVLGEYLSVIRRVSTERGLINVRVSDSIQKVFEYQPSLIFSQATGSNGGSCSMIISALVIAA